MNATSSIPALSRSALRWVRVALPVLALYVVGVAAAPAQQIDDEKARAVTANCLWKFIKYISWPGEPPEGERPPFVIGIIGNDPFGEILDEAVAGKTYEDRPFEIKRLASFQGEPKAAPPDRDRLVAAELKRCHVLYISESESKSLQKILDLLDDAPVLTCSEIKGFAEKGGMIEFKKERKVRLVINRMAAHEARLQINSRLLALATIYEPPVKRGSHRRSPQEVAAE